MNLFERWRRWRRYGASDPSKMSRINYLFWLHHDWLEGGRFSPGNLNFEQLAERQLQQGELPIATHNIASQLRYSFTLANLYWAQGDVKRTQTYLFKTLERYTRLIDACAKHKHPLEFPREIHFAKCAAFLLDQEFKSSPLIGKLELGYEPWFKDVLMDFCIETAEFDMNSWDASVDQWMKRGFPKYRIEEFTFYAKALTGQFRTVEALLSEHQKRVSAKIKRNPDTDMLDGYDQYSALVIDYIFAAILKRIGWEGTYRHSWPNTDALDAAPTTTREPNRFLKTIALEPPHPDADTGIIADTAQARRFIDQQLEDQRDHEGRTFDPKRSKIERGKVAAALKDIGWVRDAATLDLMQTYDMENILNDHAGVVLGDPFGADIDLKHSTDFLRAECGLPDDFISIAGNIESFHPDVDGGWYLYRKKDRKVYLLDRSEWEKPEAAIAAARPGFNVWPSYTSFVAWWIAQHRSGPA